MKVKILLMPLIIVIVVAISIWLVYPAYSNGASGVKENYTKLKSEQKKLTELLEKSESADDLSAQISSLPEKEMLYAFIPAETKEEEIVNNLINLASNSGLLLFDEKVNQPLKEIQLVEETASAPISNSGSAVSPIVLPKIQNLKTEIKLAGNYEKIKDFLASIGRLNRSNSFETLEISKNNSGVQSITDSNILLISAAVDFNVLKRAKLNNSNISSPIFDNSQLETKVISDIKNQKNADNFQLSVEQGGKSNLFQP
ncbi:MAG: hypothetical protein WA055_03650 [Candidatus Moraniibacteriota bacterium]